VLRAILFDFNGVLVDDEPVHLELFQRVLKEVGIEVSAGEYYEELVGYDDEDCFTAVCKRSGRKLPDGELERLVARKAELYRQRMDGGGYPFFPGAEDLVRAAIGASLHLGVVSGALRAEVEGALEQLGVRGSFKAVVAAEDVQAGKPDPEGYRRGLQLLSSEPPLPSRLLHPHEVLAIEDTPAGLAAAAGSGRVTLGVAHTLPAEELTPADKVVGSIAEVDLPQIRALFARPLGGNEGGHHYRPLGGNEGGHHYRPLGGNEGGHH